MPVIPPLPRLLGGWVLTLLFVLGAYVFGSLALASIMAERYDLGTLIYSLAAIGNLSMAIRYGREAVMLTRRHLSGSSHE